jgi:type I site-specific restriction-modification system R (restriction) subunit
MEYLLDEAMLDEAQEVRLEREFSCQYHLMTRDDRLEAVAEDIVDHCMGRGFQGKAMVVCIDKATALRMYDKVQKHWKRYLNRLEENVTSSLAEAAVTAEQVQFMKETDMAVVVSEAGSGAGYRSSSQTHKNRRPRREVQRPRQSLSHRVRLCHVDDRLRCPLLLDHLSR